MLDDYEITGCDLYYTTPDGEYKYLMGLTGVETTSAAIDYSGRVSIGPMRLSSDFAFSGVCKPVCYGRCKTRKRLVKLLMSKGFQKLAAQEIAWEVNKSPMTYQSYWLNYILTGGVGIYFWSKT